MKAKKIGVHVFICDPDDRRVCVSCHLPEVNDCHQVPTVSDAVAAAEARRLGESVPREVV